MEKLKEALENATEKKLEDNKERIDRLTRYLLADESIMQKAVFSSEWAGFFAGAHKLTDEINELKRADGLEVVYEHPRDRYEREREEEREKRKLFTCIKDGEEVFDDERWEKDRKERERKERTDPYLIKAVELKEASGLSREDIGLYIETFPAYLDWEIGEYDGKDWIKFL